MASVDDVTDALQGFIQDAVYPSGILMPSVAGIPVKIFTGWPLPADLEADIPDVKANISVFPVPNSSRDTTRFPSFNKELKRANATIVATVLDNTVTLSGTPAINQTVMINVNLIGYAYAIQAGNTLNVIAAALAALIPGATALGAVITIAGAYRLTANISVLGTVGKEVGREEMLFWVTVWAPEPQDNLLEPRHYRRLLVDAIKPYIQNLERFNFNTGEDAIVIYRGMNYIDKSELAGLYRCDIKFSVDFPSTIITTAPSIASTNINYSSS